MTQLRRAYAESLPLTDVEAVWKEFRGVAVEYEWTFTAAGWESRWKRFCDDKQKRQRVERERARLLLRSSQERQAPGAVDYEALKRANAAERRPATSASEPLGKLDFGQMPEFLRAGGKT